MIIAIDGPAGSGKSTVARQVAHRLRYELLDTGSLYRAIAYAASEAAIPLEDEKAVYSFLCQHPVTLAYLSDGLHYLVNDLDTTAFLRAQSVGHGASVVSAHPSIRTALLPIQRSFAEKKNIVCEGRDMGSTVFPHAELKIFLTASTLVRAMRRLEELNDPTIRLEEIQREIEARDHRDATRSCSPLVQAEDAVVIDTSEMTIVQVVEQIIFLARHVFLEKTEEVYWEHVQHQADIGIKGVGLTPAQAFEQAALALTAVITDPKNIAPRQCVNIRCEAENVEELLIDWLNRIIYESDVRNMLFSRFHVTMTEQALHADMWGELVDKKKHCPAVEIKGATYHGLCVEQRGNLWHAECVVDV